MTQHRGRQNSAAQRIQDICAILFLLLAIIAVSVSAATSSFIPTDDAYISRIYSEPGYSAGRWWNTVQGEGAGQEKYIYQKYDLTKISEPVSTAILKVEGNTGEDSKFPAAFQIYGSHDAPADWTENALHISNAPN